MSWEAIKSEGRVVYHKRALDAGTFLTAKRVESGWEWTVRGPDYVDGQRELLHSGGAPSVHEAKHAAEAAVGIKRCPHDGTELRPMGPDEAICPRCGDEWGSSITPPPLEERRARAVAELGVSEERARVLYPDDPFDGIAP